MTTGNYVRRALESFAEWGDLEALVTVDGRRFTFTELRARVLDTAAALWHHGIRPGMTIPLLVANSAESLFIQFGAHMLGCRTVFLSHFSPRVFLRDVLSYVGAGAFIYEADKTGEMGRELALAAPQVPVFCIGAGGLGPDLVDPPAATVLPFDPAEITAEPRSLFHTTGTTAAPKLLQHGQRFFAAIPKVARFYQPVAPEDRPDLRRMRHLTVSGTWHAGGQSSAIVTLLSGGLLVMQAGLDVGAFLAAIEKERLASTMLSPSLLYQILDDPRLPDADVSSLQFMTISVSPASPARLREALRRFGSAPNVVYGMSELPFITALTNLGDPAHPERLASCGLPWGDVRVEIRDPAGLALPPGEPGEIWVASELATEGYWNMPDLTAQALVDGWLRTGDVGRVDADGYLYILDRVKDVVMIDAGGGKLFCRPLEDALATHPQVREAAIVGVPDAAQGSDVVVAYVIRTPDATVTAEELRRFAVDRLNAMWSPHEVEFVDELPLNAFGKVDKKALREHHRRKVNSTLQ
ncbi:MAG TPA: AMP-binding protein [Pilimelia sp.]|nr:AMP-binding protein [Pilimelia sp.]